MSGVSNPSTSLSYGGAFLSVYRPEFSVHNPVKLFFILPTSVCFNDFAIKNWHRFYHEINRHSLFSEKPYTTSADRALHCPSYPYDYMIDRYRPNQLIVCACFVS